MSFRKSEKDLKEIGEVIDLIGTQMRVEGELVGLYEKSRGEIKSKPVLHLLNTIQLDSRKHINLCQTAIEVLKGEDVLQEEKAELIEGLRKHIELEEGSIERANKILKSRWIKANKGLTELFKKLRDDEKIHHNILKKLTGKTFFRVELNDVVLLFRHARADQTKTEFEDERYKESRDYWRKQKEQE